MPEEKTSWLGSSVLDPSFSTKFSSRFSMSISLHRSTVLQLSDQLNELCEHSGICWILNWVPDDANFTVLSSKSRYLTEDVGLVWGTPGAQTTDTFGCRFSEVRQFFVTHRLKIIQCITQWSFKVPYKRNFIKALLPEWYYSWLTCLNQTSALLKLGCNSTSASHSFWQQITQGNDRMTDPSAS